MQVEPDMYGTKTYILGDWGTSQCRLYLCTGDDALGTFHIIDEAVGKGIKHLTNPEDYFFKLCKRWLAKYGQMPVYLIGVVGSDAGWHQAGYIPCPTIIDTIFNNSLSFDAKGCQIHIVPGLSCTNPLGLPDTLRGEETQIIGWIANNPTQKGQLLCLPGTHTKWAHIDLGQVNTFLSSPVGELYDIINNHSVISTPENKSQWHQESFEEGLALALDKSKNILHSIFSCRARSLLNNKPESTSSSYLSGLLIGSDVRDAIGHIADFNNVTVIGNDDVMPLYMHALGQCGIKAESMKGQDASISGLKAFVRSVGGAPENHARMSG
jgi:2-dehydro-3-deoxygalactonokinase